MAPYQLNFNRSLGFAVTFLLILLAAYRLNDEIKSTKNLIVTQSRSTYGQRDVSNTETSSKYSTVKKCISREHPLKSNYTAPFLHPSQWMDGNGDIYSGMWWQSIPSMLQTNYSKLGFLEAVSFKSFQNNKRVVQTVDWLDVNVEHLSKYVKYFSGSEVEEDRVAELIYGYIERTKLEVYDVQPAISSTIAILPLRVSSLEKKNQVRLLQLQLTATLASLWAAGFPRALVVGVSHNESIAAKESFDLLEEHLAIQFMDLKYIQIDTTDMKLVPKVALARFQEIIMQSNKQQDTPINRTEQTEWLGKSNVFKWKYVYFTEPDLILHIRPEAIPSISLELERGHIINAHRLQPLPHIQQFSYILEGINSSHPNKALKIRNKVLPNAASFGSIHSLNPSSGDVCCDQGKFYPSHIDNPTSPAIKRKGCWLWEFCGFGPNTNHSDWNAIVKNHELLVMHPFLSLEQGTRIPVVHHGQRVCTARRDGTICSNLDSNTNKARE